MALASCRESSWNSNLITEDGIDCHPCPKPGSFPGTSERIRKLFKSTMALHSGPHPHCPLKLIEVTYEIGPGGRMDQTKLSLERTYRCVN